MFLNISGSTVGLYRARMQEDWLKYELLSFSANAEAAASSNLNSLHHTCI